MQNHFQARILAAALILAAVLDALVLYWVMTPSSRLTLGLITLAPIFWASYRLGVVEHVRDVVQYPRHPRRYTRLRTQVDLLLEEIRRLNHIAVDAARGVRERDEAILLMDEIEARLIQLVSEIRAAAGVEGTGTDERHEATSSQAPTPTSAPVRELTGASA